MRRAARMLAPARTLALAPALALALTVALAVTGCGAGVPADPAGGVRIVAAENFWGSIAAQLGGSHAAVQSIIVNPAQDPHSYEATAADARTLASAQLAIVNGIGYDPWASKLIAANPTSGRVVLDVGRMLGLSIGANPHRWYDPAAVTRVASAITHALERLDPAHAHDYRAQQKRFLTTDLAGYHALIDQIERRYHGTPVGASESIFALLAPSLGLKLLTPPSFMKAISEGSEVTAQDTLTTQRQITSHDIKVWIYNSQNATPQVQQLTALARTNHIPVVTITETLAPQNASFEQWQVAQLRRLENALQGASGQ
jgi:zinc/manganese transport system substrate-binding protein